MAEYNPVPPILTCPEYHGGAWTPLDINNRTYAFNATVQIYLIFCDVNLGADLPNINTGVKDIVHIANVDSLSLCVDLCARYTLALPIVQSNRTEICRLVSLDLQGVCWLKTDSDSPSYTNTPNGYASALLSIGWLSNMTTMVQGAPPLGGDSWRDVPLGSSGN